MNGQKSGLEAALAAATKLDASLHAQGKLAKNVSEGVNKSDVLKLIQAEFSINHVPQVTRNLLCKRSTQNILREFSGACVSTKGKYIPESERNTLNAQDNSSKNLGLYLFIQGPTNRSVDLAVQKIEEMIAKTATSQNNLSNESNGNLKKSSNISISTPSTTRFRTPKVNLTPMDTLNRTVAVPPNAESTSGKIVEKIRIGINNPLPSFNLPMKLIGQGGSNLNYIKNETGAIVTLRGIGSAFMEPGTQQEAPEPLHFCIVHKNADTVVAARELALNLVATVQQEYAHFQMRQPPPQNIPPQVQQISIEPPPNLVLHQPGNGEQSIIQQQFPNVMSTSISLPVVQTGFIQQPAVTQLTAPPPTIGVPPPHFSQPPPPQVALPPPGVHIPQQQGPLVPPPAPQQVQLQPQQNDPGNFIQQIAQPFPAGQQTSQQQYVITQNSQPMQGIMTSQGLVVLNQQTQPTYTQQQVFLSQPPPVNSTQPVFQPGQQLAFQSPATGQQVQAAVSVPVSYQFQYVQQNPPPTMTYSPVQNSVQAQPSQIQIHPPQSHALTQSPNVSTGQSPVPNQHPPQSGPNVSQPPPSLPNQSPAMQNHSPNQRNSPNLQAPPPNQPNPTFSVQPTQNQMFVQQIPNHQMIQTNQPIPIQNQSIQTIPGSSPNFIPNQPQLMQIQGTRPPTEVQPQFQLQQQNFGQYPQQIVMKQIQLCQPQQLQFVPGCPPSPIQILPAATGQFISSAQHFPPGQFNQNVEPPQEPKPPKRKFTEEMPPTTQQNQTSPQSLMSIPMQPPQPVPPPAQTLPNNTPNRQGVGVQELMIMNQQQRRQHLQQPEGLQKDPSQKVEETSVAPSPSSSAGNQQNFLPPEPGTHNGDKNNQKQFTGFEENQVREPQTEESREGDERNGGFRRDRNRDRPTFSHYSSKPQMYDKMAQHPAVNLVGPPPPPPPSHLVNKPPNQQQPVTVAVPPYYHSNRTY